MTCDRKTTSARQAINRVTCHLPLVTVLLLAGCGKSGDGNGGTPQPKIPAKSNFTSVEYYPAPNQTRVKTRLTGADAQPLAGGLLVIQQLKLESVNTNGNTQAVVEAPECIYDTQNHTANSAGHLRLQNGDGKIRLEGDGFLWRQDDSFLTISNHVHTVIESRIWRMNAP